MATGVPKTRVKDQGGRSTAPTLQFIGKRSAEEIYDSCRDGERHHLLKGASTSNRLYFSENLSALGSLRANESVAGKVRLIYIDPPYATQTVFHSRSLDHAYEDVFHVSEYLAFLHERIVLLHSILSEDGSIYVHIDGKMLFHAKLILDEVFGSSNFRNCITRKKCNPKNYTRKTYGNISDYLLFYTKSERYVWNRQTEPMTEKRAVEYQYVDGNSGRRYMKVPVHAPGVRNGETGGQWKGMSPPPGKHWQYKPSTLDELDARGEIFWSKNGNPRRKVFLDDNEGIPVQDIWMDYRDAHNQNVDVTGYPTEKNKDLLRRIISASSNPGDLVLDCFAGSGTTLVAANELERRWIGVDSSRESLRTILRRFAFGSAPMGSFAEQAGVVAPTLFDLQPLQPLLTFASPDKIEDFQLLVSDDLLAEGKRILNEALAEHAVKKDEVPVSIVPHNPALL